jgi:hypothetical protein
MSNSKRDQNKRTEYPEDYDVGYCKPPKNKQFRPGISGNPAGRPKGSKKTITATTDLAKAIQKVAKKKVNVNGNEVEALEAMIHVMGADALKGCRHARRDFMALATLIEKQQHAERDARLKQSLDYKTWWYEEERRRRAGGLWGPMPTPHPDDIHIDMETKEVTYTSLTREEVSALEGLLAERDRTSIEIAALQTDQAEPSLLEYEVIIADQLDRALKRLAGIDEIFEGCGIPRAHLVNANL